MDAPQIVLMSALEGNHWWYRATHELVESCILKFIGRDKAFFDAGCGTGGLIKTLASLGTVRGCDANSLCVRLARKRAPAEYRANIYEHSIEGIHEHEQRRFDCVTCIDVLYHKGVKNWRSALGDLTRILNPGGHLILQVPAFSALQGSHDNAVHGERRFRLPEIQCALEEYGMQPTLITYRLSYLFPIMLLRRLLSRITAKDSCKSDFEDMQQRAEWMERMCEGAALHFSRVENRLLLRGVRAPFGSSLFVTARSIK
jgi:2-polyprenyl-3-methyl-5-hydroxy-6-metoxy-1,4-benzoquinol methylase